MKTILCFIFLFVSHYSYCQYDNTYVFLTKNCNNIFKSAKGTFFNNVAWKKIDGRKQNYMYTFSDTTINLKYLLHLQKDSTGDRCDYFSIMGHTISLNEKFENNFACELDETSLCVYKGIFSEKQYILVTCTNNGSGSYTTSIICNLFDITNPKEIKYFPLWSKFGGISCFGDFNNDGQFDFLKVRNYKGQRDCFIITLTTLKNDKFISFEENKYYIIVKINQGKISKVIKKKWF